MITKTSVSETFNCSLTTAFKTPILGDATKTLTGYGIIPPVSHFTEDETWGQINGTRMPHSSKSLLSKGGEIGLDVTLERDENRYWNWQVTDFRQWSMGFTKFQGEFFFEKIEENKISVLWVYRLTSTNLLAYPFHYFFTKVLWKGNMRGALKRMKSIAESKENTFLYS